MIRLNQCYTCGALILFGGISRDGVRYCGKRCCEEAELDRALDMVPVAVAESEAMRIRSDPCPVCGREGSRVELRASYRATGFLLHTSLSEKHVICCTLCGLKANLRAIAHSLLFGWWGFPFGIIAVPMQVLRNLFAMLPSFRKRISWRFMEAVRMDIAAGILAQGEHPPVLPEGTSATDGRAQGSSASNPQAGEQPRGDAQEGESRPREAPSSSREAPRSPRPPDHGARHQKTPSR